MRIEDFVLRAQVRRGIAMAGKAPAHVQIFGLPGEIHVTNRAMALRTSDALRDMDAVIEEDVVG
jgi:hypothetical protein